MLKTIIEIENTRLFALYSNFFLLRDIILACRKCSIRGCFFVLAQLLRYVVSIGIRRDVYFELCLDFLARYSHIGIGQALLNWAGCLAFLLRSCRLPVFMCIKKAGNIPAFMYLRQNSKFYIASLPFSLVRILMH
jgi:hypothetical protein